jgi:hypothetical protein
VHVVERIGRTILVYETGSFRDMMLDVATISGSLAFMTTIGGDISAGMTVKG